MREKGPAPARSTRRRTAWDTCGRSGGTGNVPVPGPVGKNAAVAQDDLRRLGFPADRIKFSPVGHAFVATPTHWKVTEQSEKPRAQVSLQELIVLKVVKWPPSRLRSSNAHRSSFGSLRVQSAGRVRRASPSAAPPGARPALNYYIM